MPRMIERSITDWSQKYRQEGRQEGEKSLLLRLLHSKFGRLDKKSTALLEQASISQIEAWGERILKADTLDEVFLSKQIRTQKKTRHTQND